MVVGHHKQWEFLKRSMERGRIPHALLFSGEEGLGKRTLALEFIKLLNCQSSFSGQPCRVCRSCQEIEKKIYPDLVLVAPSGIEGKREIGVAEIRALRSRMALRSFRDGFKAAIIDGADFLTPEAQNSFLKLLEEPKGRTIFILIARHAESLLPTVLSRVEILKFYPVAESELQALLKSRGLSEKEAQEISSLSWGRPGRALDFISQPENLKKCKQMGREISQLINLDFAQRFQYVKKISQEPKPEDALEVWLHYFRTMLLSRSQCPYPLSELAEVLAVIEETQVLLSTTNINPRLALERLMLAF